MKKLIYVFVILIIISCNSKSNEIPSQLTGNKDVKVYFETLSDVIDEYINLIEDLAENSPQKSGDEPDFNDAMNMFSTMANSTMKMAPLLEKMDELEKEGEILKNDLSEEELVEFVKVYEKMMLRFMEASKNINP